MWSHNIRHLPTPLHSAPSKTTNTTIAIITNFHYPSLSHCAGVVSLSSILTGTALGGIILRWVRPGPTYVAAYNVLITLALSAGFVALMFIGCPKLNVVGPVQGWVGLDFELHDLLSLLYIIQLYKTQIAHALALSIGRADLFCFSMLPFVSAITSFLLVRSPVPPCSSDCGCSDKFSPMCAADNETLFYSPCYAACKKVETFANPVVSWQSVWLTWWVSEMLGD